MLHLSLSLEYGAQKEDFMNSCIEVLTSPRVTLQRGSLELAPRAFVLASVRFFIPGGKAESLRRCLLASLPESDWQNHQTITLLVDDETYATADHDQFKFEFATLLVRLAFSHQLRKWQKKDWKGVCESAADVGMLLLPHGLLKIA
jgi:hypothetical protein